MNSQPAAPGRRLCGVSIDVDSVTSHLRGYGLTALADRDEHLLVAVPRAIELFSRLNVRATFFFNRRGGKARSGNCPFDS